MLIWFEYEIILSEDIDTFHADNGIFCANLANTMTADALAPWIA